MNPCRRIGDKFGFFDAANGCESVCFGAELLLGSSSPLASHLRKQTLASAERCY